MVSITPVGLSSSPPWPSADGGNSLFFYSLIFFNIVSLNHGQDEKELFIFFFTQVAEGLSSAAASQVLTQQ